MKMIAHDMRAPIGVFERFSNSPGLPEYDVNLLKQSINRLHSMIESFRYSEIEAIIRRSATTLCFDDGIAMLRGKNRSKPLKVNMVVDVPGLVSIDSTKLERAWMNLVSNAIDAAKTMVTLESEFKGSGLIIRVIDDGPGVPEEFLPKLFQRGATHGKHDGTGLGLAYVRQIVRGHGGDVTYRRESGLTIFECYLPNAVVRHQEDTLQDQSAPLVEKAIKVKQVGICFVPKSMAESVCAQLASHSSVKFSFSIEYEGADIVATNDPDLALTAIEEGKHPLEFRAKLSEAVVVDMLKRRFELV